ncbi:MAG: polyvinylalcohol dehydrogenase [Pirellula sp.]|nr:polyvinylalcohol dehydrogenase [Pirellula sp.]
MSLRAVVAVLLLPVALETSPAPAADWSQWRGPARTGISQETGLAKSWPADGPPLAWKITGLGEGFSTPSVAGGKLFVMGNRKAKAGAEADVEQEYVLAYDVRTQGKELWATAIGPVRHKGAGYAGPRSTPTVDGDRLYAIGLNGDLVCLDVRSGEILWRHDFVAEFDGKIPTWGYTESPLVDGPWVVVTPGGGKATFAAFDKLTGKQAWGSEFGERAGYASIAPAVIDGVKQYVQFMHGAVVGVDARNGVPLWRYEAPANGTANCSTVLVAGNKVFAASGYGTGGGAADIKKEGDKFAADEAFFTKKMKNHHGGMVLVDGFLYGSDDPGILTCIELATGKDQWQERAPGKCSLIYFAGGQMITRSEKGKLCLVNVSPEKCEVVSEFEQPDRSDKPSWPHPVVADGMLYLRDQGTLLVYDVRAKQ